MQLPLAPKLSGKNNSLSSKVLCKFCKTQPASTVAVIAEGLISLILLMRSSDTTIALPFVSGTEPPATLVLPLCGTTGVAVSKAIFIISATSAVFLGLITAAASPVILPDQSLIYLALS